jgi:hypothetical protein
MGFPTLRTSSRSSTVPLPPATTWEVVASGRRGRQWYADAAPFVLRGALDRLVGGAGRSWDPPGTPVLSPGDAAGFWRVVEAATYDGGRGRLLLEAAVRAPGRVRLESRVDPLGPHRTRITQQVSFEPRGIVGHAYLLADLPAREAVVELTHRRLLADLRRRTA